MDDATDMLMAQWRRERPDLDFWPVGVVGRVTRLAALLQKEFREFFARHGLEKGEWDVMALLRRSGEPYELSAGALLKETMVTSGAITNRIDRMEAKGLVERVRDPADRRSVIVRLTRRGVEACDEVIALHMANEARLLAALGEDDREDLAALLRRVLVDLGDTSL
ncbi:MarR family transcriptional regulator [Nonomuraea roseoviolacea subsp. roseoviolacea]|uniref:DNA-binding MarR family transcriptional regulator n=1 Tax=Nonomuraea roseoviolacea subsp. carminata TaxID=160689 RepID=A0ABT1KBK9_9ACTN|nr:MarR family transcriptional regulator [Nonomuraea roseoviolacea]MCP2351388.1 DNA-binding MarR family transcriptional regulator [Nonomuraea roseoviolacea subsp. carminata]